jgi:hypothetical protein
MRANIIRLNFPESDTQTANKFAVLLHSTFANKCAVDLPMSVFFNGMDDRNASKYVPHR